LVAKEASCVALGLALKEKLSVVELLFAKGEGVLEFEGEFRWMKKWVGVLLQHQKVFRSFRIPRILDGPRSDEPQMY
jgi:hypothetical protein